MCLQIDSKIHKNPIPLTAKKDIEVFKVIHNDNYTVIQGFKYEPNTLYRHRKSLKCYGGYNIFHGFHSYDEKVTFKICNKDLVYKQADVINLRYNNREISNYDVIKCKIVKFIIPKGAKYFIGTDGDKVSTSIRSGDLKNILET